MGHLTQREHVVQFYGLDGASLVENVAGFLAEGLRAGEEAIVIAAQPRADAIVRALESPDRVTVLDAAETLDSFMVDGFPDPLRFDESVGHVVRTVCARSGGSGASAYGEMVGLLWQAQKYPAAIRLEQLWNVLLSRERLRLFCGYPIDVLSDEFDASLLNALFCAHDTLVPSDASGSLAGAIDRALDEVLGRQRRYVDAADVQMPSSCARLPDAEAWILRLRSALPERANDVLARAREHYTAAS